MNTLLLIHDEMIDHVPGDGHPDRPDRLRVLHERLAAAPIEGTTVRASEPASPEAIARIHSARYVSTIDAAEGRRISLDRDTHLSAGSVNAARLAAGAATGAVDAIMSDDFDSAFAFVRPPGHHALAERAMGFCIFNNVAIAAAHAQAQYGIERILIVDWDVHHGNGTEAMFYERDDVLFFSTHQFPFYPGSGAVRDRGRGAGRGTTVNVPLPAGSTDADLRLSFRELLEPIAEQFRPQLVLVSAGFDAHRLDPVGHFELSADGFADLCSSVRTLAKRHAQGRIALVLEGGYDLEGLASSALACTRVLAGQTPPDASEPPSIAGEQAVAAARAAQRDHWRF